MVIANLYTNLSSANCNPVSFEFLGGQFSTIQTPVLFSNGLRINTNDILQNCVDFTTNNKTSIFLTNLTKASDFLTDNSSPQLSGILTEIDSPVTGQLLFHSPVKDENLNVIKLKPFDSTLSRYYAVTSNYNDFNQDDVFKFIFQPDNSVVVENVKTQYYLTSFYGNTAEPNVSLLFQPKIQQVLSTEPYFVNGFNDAQRFDYALGHNTISLFEINDQFLLLRFQNAVTKSNTGVYVLSSLNYLTSSTPFPFQCSLNLISYEQAPALNSDIKDSFLAKYIVSPVSGSDVLNIDYNIKDEMYTQNYLGIFPFQYPKQTNHGVTYPLAFHGLKNYQTPEYNYSFGVQYVEGQNGVRRTYEKIYTGSNQNLGLDNVYLGYLANTIQMTFQPNIETLFYFTPTSERMPLSATGLIEDGAIAGEIPITADRISVKLQNYEELIPTMPQPPSISNYSNTWLCSWLSGSMEGDKIWMDRYYNPAYFTIEQALSTKVMQYVDRLYPEESYTFDTPSQMYMEPGVLYSYFHTGKQNRLNVIQHLSSNSILQVTNWNSSPLVDESPLMGEGIIYFNNPNNLQGKYFNLDGTTYALFPATTNLLSESKLTVSLWVNVKNWDNVTGTQIFGNYYNSGFGLINDASITTPIITLIDNNADNIYGNEIYNFNYKYTILQSLTSNHSSNKGNKFIQKFPDYSYWVFDSSTRFGVKYDVNNQITNTTVPISGNLFTNLDTISQIQMDSNQNLYLFDATRNECAIINSTGNLVLSTINLGTAANSIQVDLQDNLIPCYGMHSAIGNNNEILEIVGGNLYINKNLIANIGYVQQIMVDSSNFLWILNSQDTLTKVDINNKVIIFNNRIGLNATAPLIDCFNYGVQFRLMNIIRVPKDANSNACNNVDSPTEDRIIIIDSNEKNIYTVDTNGNLLTKLSFHAITNNDVSNLMTYGDLTGYEFLRKYTTNNKTLSWKLQLANPNGQNQIPMTLSYNVSGINQGWHHFTLVVDSENGIVRNYIDSILIDEQTFDPTVYQIYYNYRTSLLLGCETIQNTTINDIISIDSGYKFVGEVAELRLYDKSLSQGEIEQLYLSSPNVPNDYPLVWNMSTGDRNYIEQIKHWYKFQMPGSKSKYYNINIHNLEVPQQVKSVIEAGIESNIHKIAPTNTSLYKINWL
jgi:hypothetical protein